MAKKKEGLEPTGIAEIDGLAARDPCTIQHYISAVSAYVRKQRGLAKGPKKAAQIRLSNALGRAFLHDLRTKLPALSNAVVGERKVAGALRTMNADVSESHELDGLRLAVELKPVNLAVGRAIWNRFGDLRTFAVNIHLKFPFAVVGGVLVIPTYEETGTNAAKLAEAEEHASEEGDDAIELADKGNGQAEGEASARDVPQQRSTRHLIDKAVERLIRAGGRKTEADAAHLLEGIAVVAYDPKTGKIDSRLPSAASGLRWGSFIDQMARSYEARFEE